jgi:hypothetical protein
VPERSAPEVGAVDSDGPVLGHSLQRVLERGIGRYLQGQRDLTGIVHRSERRHSAQTVNEIADVVGQEDASRLDMHNE